MGQNTFSVDWEQMSPAELEQQFNPRVAVPDFQTYLDAWADHGRRARERLRFVSDIRYGSGPRQLLDVIPAGPPGPAVIYVHGGFWRALSKNAFAGIAGTLHPLGITTVLVGYDLCPAVSLDRQVDQVGEAIGWCLQNLADYGVDTRRVVLAGSSAGAHLLASNLLKPERQAWHFAGACLCSGIYDVQPVLRISVNEDVRLDAIAARRNSPVLNVRRIQTPLMFAVGANESPAWIAQSRQMHQSCVAAGNQADLLVIPGAHHFSVGLGRTDSAATKALVTMIDRSKPASAAPAI